MFLTFAVMGSWQTVLVKHLAELGFSNTEAGMIMATSALAAVISPLFAGQIADRWFPTQWFLALMNLVSGIVLLMAYTQDSFWALWALMFVNGLFFVTTIPLGTSMSMQHLGDPTREFPAVRAWGTIGWVLSAFALSGWFTITGGEYRECLALGGGIAFLNALYSCTLPHTPPRRDAAQKFALGKVLVMLKGRSFLVFTLMLFLIATVSFPFYVVGAAKFYPDQGVSKIWLPIVMAIGQIVEIPLMFLLPWVYRRFGAKATLAIGMATWAIRFGIYTLVGPLWLMIAAQILHGPGFAFTRIGASIYIDRIVAKDARASAQSFLSTFADGSGMVAGSFVAGYVADSVQVGLRDGSGWSEFWFLAAIGCAVITAAFVAFFRARDREPLKA